jgi:citrate synthase
MRITTDTKIQIHRGLDGVYVGETSISDVDGEHGRLIYRDFPIEELIHLGFSDVAFLVIFGRRPSEPETRAFEALLAENSDLSSGEIEILKQLPPHTHPMKMLQGLVPLLDLQAKNGAPDWMAEEAARGLVLAAKIPALIAAHFRLRAGQSVLPSRLGLSYHENFLYRMNGRLPTREQVKILDITQILQMEHGFNASTFAARVTASTLAPVECAISTAIGTLYGKLHGGADQAALETGLAVGDPERAEAFVLESLRNKRKIMGMGHRIYRVVDPRAKILKPLARSLCEGTPFWNLYLTMEKIEDVMEREMATRGKAIKANVEFYKGPVFYALGVPPEYFTALFAMSRVFGYLAHVLESRKDNKLIRPKALYVSR